MIWTGIAAAFAGFVVLSYADSLGRNWAASVSPFLILGGYAVVGLGIFWESPQGRLEEKSKAAPSAFPPSASS